MPVAAPVINRMVDMPDPSALSDSDAGQKFWIDHAGHLTARTLLLDRARLILEDGREAADRSGDESLTGYVDALTYIVEDAEARGLTGEDIVCLPAEHAHTARLVATEMDAASGALDRATGIVEALSFASASLDEAAELASRFDADLGIDVRVGAVDEHEWEAHDYQVQPASWVSWDDIEDIAPGVRERIMPVADALRAALPYDVLDTGRPLDPTVPHPVSHLAPQGA